MLEESLGNGTDVGYHVARQTSFGAIEEESFDHLDNQYRPPNDDRGLMNLDHDTRALLASIDLHI